jgi:hypothetical protein
VSGRRLEGNFEAYGLECSDLADAVVGRDVVYCHAPSLYETEVGVLLNALECAVLRAEVEGGCPVVARRCQYNPHLSILCCPKKITQTFFPSFLG